MEKLQYLADVIGWNVQRIQASSSNITSQTIIDECDSNNNKNTYAIRYPCTERERGQKATNNNIKIIL